MRDVTQWLSKWILGVLSLVTLPASAAPPAWWNDDVLGTRILIGGAPVDHYAPLNLGQLKNVAAKARMHLAQALDQTGGAGPSIDAMILGFQNSGDNYAPANLGQLKAIAKPFYERLIEIGYNTKQNLRDHGAANWAFVYPWTPNPPFGSNYAPANIGQVKLIFSFETQDTDDDGMPDWWEVRYSLNPATASDRDAHHDNDGITNFQEFASGRNPLTAPVPDTTGGSVQLTVFTRLE